MQLLTFILGGADFAVPLKDIEFVDVGSLIQQEERGEINRLIADNM